MRHLCYIFLLALSVGNLACNRTPKHNFDMQKAIEAQGVSVRKVVLNPAMLTPFLDSKNVEEAALKEFLRRVSEVRLFSLSSKKVADGVVEAAEAARYVLSLDFRPDSSHSMLVYTQLLENEEDKNLIIMLQESNEIFYGVEVGGSVDANTIANLRRISPAFIDSYIRRFNVRF